MDLRLLQIPTRRASILPELITFFDDDKNMLLKFLRCFSGTTRSDNRVMIGVGCICRHQRFRHRAGLIYLKKHCVCGALPGPLH